MEHLKRIHALEATAATASPGRSSSEGHVSMYEESGTDIENEGSVIDVVGLGSSEKVLLKAKLHEFKCVRADWVTKIAKLDGDIAAMERIIDLM